MEKNRFKVKYIRLNKPCEITIQRSDAQNDLKFNVGEVYFKEYKDTFDIFFVIDKRKLYLKAINMQKSFYYDTIMSHINTLKSGCYKINENSIKNRPDGLIDMRFIEKLEEEIYGEE